MKLQGIKLNLTDWQRSNLQEWVTALRSKRYMQGLSALKKTSDCMRYCCLGVACESNKIPSEEVADGLFQFHFGDDAYMSMYPATQWFQEMYGFEPDSSLNAGIYGHMNLASLNDSGYSFNTIADVIEACFLKGEDIEITK